MSHPLPPVQLPQDLHAYEKHDIVDCPVCGASLLCLCNRPADCPCAQVNLTRDESEWISWQTGGECVCVPCLMRLREQAREALGGDAG